MPISEIQCMPASPESQSKEAQIAKKEAEIAELETHLETLNVVFMAEISDNQRMNIQRELFALQTALDHYKAALDLERSGASTEAHESKQ